MTRGNICDRLKRVKMRKFDISRKAAEDLFNIWEYTCDNWSESQADKYYSFLTAAFEEIVASPEKIGKPYDFIHPGLRALHVRRHMVFYLLQSNYRVLIVRILHERMDYIRHL